MLGQIAVWLIIFALFLGAWILSIKCFIGPIVAGSFYETFGPYICTFVVGEHALVAYLIVKYFMEEGIL